MYQHMICRKILYYYVIYKIGVSGTLLYSSLLMSVGIQINFHVWGVFRDAVKRGRTIAIVYSTLKHLTLKPYRFNSAVIVVR